MSIRAIKILLRFAIGFSVCLSSGLTYAAPATAKSNPDPAPGSLWLNLDSAEPQAPVPAGQEVNVSPFANPDQALPPPVQLKSVCQVLTDQSQLGDDVINSSKMQSQLKLAISNSKPEYATILSDPTLVKKLYVQYRNLYLQMNCMPSTNTNSNTATKQ